jgi:periplasmic protein TonB
MFEDSLIESANRIRSKSKYWSLVTFALNVAVLLAVIVWPLLHPAALPTQVMAPLMVAPPPPPPSPPRAAPAPKVQVTSQMLVNEPSRIQQITKLVSAIPPSTEGVIKGIEGGSPGGVGSVLDGIGLGAAITVKQASSKPLALSSGVMAGNLLTKTMPQYPPIPRAAGIQGTVVLQATISKMGIIQNIQVVSGPPMLRQAAMDAVRTWRYKPYLLNGEPIEVETTINVVFNLGQ